MDLEWNLSTRNAPNQMKLVESHEVMPSPWRSPAFCQPWAIIQAGAVLRPGIQAASWASAQKRVGAFVYECCSPKRLFPAACANPRGDVWVFCCVWFCWGCHRLVPLKASCFLRRRDKADLVLTLPGAKTCNCLFCGKHLKKRGLRGRWKLTGVSS